MLPAFPPVIEPGQTALAGLLILVAQVQPGLIHGLAYHIVADISGAAEEIAQIAGIHSAHGGDGVALDAGDLHKPANGVAGQTQVVLHSHLGGVFHLIQVLPI